MQISRVAVLATALLVTFLGATSTSAAVLMVGGGAGLKMPSDAAKIAHDGDTIVIAPGKYVDCAIWSQNNLTIESSGKGVVITSKSCGGKGIFVIKGNDTTVSGITFSNAKVPDMNGAGIREAGKNLTVINSTFSKNQMGILSNPSPDSTIIIRDSTFTQNGTCFPNCPANIFMHALYIGKAALLQVENSTFSDQHDGHYIKSRASRTEVINSTIKDGPNGTGSYEIDIPNGGSVLIQGNTLEKGAKSENANAISIGEEGVTNPTPDITIKDNKYTNDSGRQSTFVRNSTSTTPVLSGNTMLGSPTPILIAGPKPAKKSVVAANALGDGIVFDACSPIDESIADYCAGSTGDPSGNTPVQLATGGFAAAGPRSQIPEPSTLSMLLLGFAGLGFSARRRIGKCSVNLR